MLKAVPSVLLLVCMTAGLVAVWYRNRDILRDLFDYSTVVTAAGKVEAGYKPYTGVRSPMQSATYLLNYWTELAFGRNYLALTWGGLLQALGGALLVRWIARASFSPLQSTVIAAAVALAGLSQHVVFFYNPIGILCLTLAWLGLAADPELRPGARTVAVFGALFLGGINKLSFHGATMAVAGLMMIAACAADRITVRVAIRNLVWMGVAGVGAPLWFELVWTGASLREWWENVVLLPQARLHSWGQILDSGIYLRPVYSFHHFLLVPAIGGIGLAFLWVTGAHIWWNGAKEERPAFDLSLRAGLILAGSLFGGLLMITNHETVMLTSLAFLIAGIAFHVLYRPPVSPRLPVWLMASAWVWVVAGGYAAWHGSRVLYATERPSREGYVRLDSPARALAYFRGVRMPPDQVDALERTAARLKTLEDSRGRLPEMLFGPALEWMERAYPETIAKHEPIWYHAGTSLHDADVDYFRELLDGGRRRLIAQRGWQAWPPAIARILEEGYREETVGSRDVLYHPRRGAAGPILADESNSIPANVYRDAVGGNVLIRATQFSRNMALHPSAAGMLFGATENTAWSWPRGARDFQGEAVAENLGNTCGSIIFRVFTGGPDGNLLWEAEGAVTPTQRVVRVPLRVQAGDGPLWLQTEKRGGPGAQVLGGWRELRINHADDRRDMPALPFGQGLQLIGASDPESNLWFGTSPEALHADNWATVPWENWRWQKRGRWHIRVTVELIPNEADPGDPVVVTLGWYRAGRFEIMSERMVDLRKVSQLTLDARMPEAEGWAGVLTRPAGGRGARHQSRILAWETD